MAVEAPETSFEASPVTIVVDEGQTVSGLFTLPAKPRALYVFAHGAGAGMDHPFMATVTAGLAARGIATLRYQFAYVERGSKRVDRPEVAHKAVRAAVRHGSALLPGTPLIAGGKSFGGRMTSQAQALDAMPGVVGLAFFGFPLHPAGKPSITRAEHLADVQVPMLFLQGTKDTLAEMALIESVTAGLGRTATLHLLREADHGLHVLVRSGRTDAQVMNEALATFDDWFERECR